MAKASPLVSSFNAGEFSELLDGRVDLERYGASTETFRNFIAAPQGPAVSRSGTAFVTEASDSSETVALVPFVVSPEDARQLEFSKDRIRFLTEDGVQTYPSEFMTAFSSPGAPVEFTSSTFGAQVGDDVVLSGYPVEFGINGRTARVTAVSGDDFTLDYVYPADQSVVSGAIARVYHIASPFTEEERKGLRYTQSVSRLYLFVSSRRTMKLTRKSSYEWVLEYTDFIDGPYLPVNDTDTTLDPGGTGNAVPIMTSDTAPSGVASASSNRPLISGTFGTPVEFLDRELPYELEASEAYFAFDNSDATYWASNAAQQGAITYTPATPFVCDGYTIFAAKDNQDTNYKAVDYAPSTFKFQGFDGTVWVNLDEQENYVLYDGNKSVFFEIDNSVAYEAYRLNVSKCTRNGLIEPRVRRLIMREKDQASINLVASSTVGINGDQGFLSTDVGRLIRIKGTDNTWRACEITTVNSTTSVTVDLKGEPLLNGRATTEWRLGYWSDTTGWPVGGAFHEDRLWLVASDAYPDMFAGSVTSGYENFQQATETGEVLDDSAIVGELNARKLSKIRWVSSDTKGLLLGTGSEEYVLSTPLEEILTPSNARPKVSTRRGSAFIEPARVDGQVLYVQRSGRAVREMAFVFESNGYRSPSMSQLAGHIGSIPFAELAYAQEPHSIVWARRTDGSLVGMTYDREENVVGWHQHDLSGYVESISVSPQADQLQDALWVVIRREVGGETKRYVERLTRFWDFDTDLADAVFVDSSLRYAGPDTDTFYGMQHLEGLEVFGLADGNPVGPFTVVNGSVQLDAPASQVVLGIGYDSVAVLPRVESGARDGTAHGKTKRIHRLIAHVWRSYGGEIGLYNEQEEDFVYEPLEYKGDLRDWDDVALFSGVLPPVTPATGYDRDGKVAFRRDRSSPLPFNVTAVTSSLNTQDA